MFRSNDHQKSSIEQRMRREVAVWRYLDHPNVAKFLGIAHLEPGRPPGVVSPYMEQNNILAYLAQHPEVLHKKVRPSNFWRRKGHTLTRAINRSDFGDCSGAGVSA